MDKGRDCPTTVSNGKVIENMTPKSKLLLNNVDSNFWVMLVLGRPLSEDLSKRWVVTNDLDEGWWWEWEWTMVVEGALGATVRKGWSWGIGKTRKEE